MEMDLEKPDLGMQSWNNNLVVSICCLTYNHEPYIRQCLDGIMMQKVGFSFEVLIHDDASTDETAIIIKEYEAKYPNILKPIYQTENQYSKGIGVTNVYQFPRAKGKYIALCECDDYWTDPYKLQKQVDFLEKNPEYSMCFHPAEVVYESEKKVDYELYVDLEERDYSASEILYKWTVPTASVMFRQKFIKNIIRDKRFMFGDIVLFLSMTQCGKIFCLKDNMSVYRRVDSGMMMTFKRNIDTLIKTVNHYEAIKEHFPNVDKKIINKKIILCYVPLFFKYLAKFNYKCIWCFYKGMILSPAFFFEFFFKSFRLAIKNRI